MAVAHWRNDDAWDCSRNASIHCILKLNFSAIINECEIESKLIDKIETHNCTIHTHETHARINLKVLNLGNWKFDKGGKTDEWNEWKHNNIRTNKENRFVWIICKLWTVEIYLFIIGFDVWHYMHQREQTNPESNEN